ncbi:hypothetical protein P3S68_033379 [Capsicum galapagoense]
MKRLKLLCIYKFDTHDAIEYLPNSLAWIDIFRYPWESLQKNLNPKDLFIFISTEVCCVIYGLKQRI